MKDDYSQPEFYRFNQDSIQLVSFAIDNLVTLDFESSVIADLCCGSGVIGLEFFKRAKVAELHFYEKQEEFIVHLKRNIEEASILERSQVKHLDLSKAEADQCYDLILMNPPYYLESSSRLPSNKERRVARFITRDGVIRISRFLSSCMKDNAYAFVVVPKRSLWINQFEEEDLVIEKEKILGDIKFLKMRKRNAL